jgi:hypothetical protein
LGIYDIEKSIREQYFPIFPKARIYSAYDEIGLYLAGLPHVPVQSLELYRFPGVSEISDVEAINYKDEEPGEWIRHQEDLFELLADLNPHAQFVIARYPSMGKDAELICNYVHEERRIALERYYYGAGISLLDLVKKHGITHVNVSFVLRWIQSIKNIARQECGIDPDQVSDEYWKELLEIERAPLEALKQAQSTTLVFKGLDNYPKYEVNPSSFDYLNQCTPYANFIRVGHFSVADSQMPATGIPAKLEWLDRNQKKNTRCADLFVNGGFEKKNIHDKAIFGPKPLPFIVDGLQYFIAGQEHVVMSSSIATPLALSYSIYLQERYHQTHHRYPTTDEIIADLRVNPGDPWMIDPLLHDQFDLLIKE